MASVLDRVTSHVNDNKHIYNNPANITTLVLWAIALGSHAVLIPLFVRQVLMNKNKSSLFD